MQTLDDTLSAGLKFGGPDFYKRRVPAFIPQNLKNGEILRPYQFEAFGRFDFYWNDYHERPQGGGTQLLYHMATGSGKTLIMAGLIFYLYRKGYRNFLFFVNSATIINKTRDNFLNSSADKYLFADEILIDEKIVRLREVESFQGVNPEDINIVFSTIQGLHYDLNTPRENSLTYEDFEQDRVVLISDEAHHINAETKRGKAISQDQQADIISWERTVDRIFRANAENVLLEFTATADMSNPGVLDKYKDKVLYDYPLKQFRLDGYSKEVKVMQADMPPFQRALQAVLMSQYRRKIFEKNGQLIKPVILFKSKTIKESQQFFLAFSSGIATLKATQLEQIENGTEDPVIRRIFDYFRDHKISAENLIAELQEDFSPDKLLSVNSKDESEDRQLAVNSLEDERNEIRAVFAVDKLNEGWDVLNLFDIVRLYNTRDGNAGRPGKTTMAEAQLIGRGARYCPFRVSADQPVYMRKYDEDLLNELRICEELYYHCTYNPQYISELYNALVEIGIRSKEQRERKLNLKDEFKQTPFYQKGLIFLNELQAHKHEDIFQLKHSLISETYKFSLNSGFVQSGAAFATSGAPAAPELVSKDMMLSDLGAHVVRKALSLIEFYEFSRLKTFFPNLSSITAFISSVQYLGGIKLEVTGTKGRAAEMTADEKLEAAIAVLKKISVSIASDLIKYQGSKEFKPFMLKDKLDDKVLNFSESGPDQEFGRSMVNASETSVYLDLAKKDWYVFDDCFGTSEEKLLIRYIGKIYEQLAARYEQVYLVRNERHFKLYNFKDGRAVEPDFVLFLVEKETRANIHYQVFIEPKGPQLLKMDEWKEDFLKTLQSESRVDQLWRGKEYVIWGMPFYNEPVRKSAFEDAIKNLL